MTLSQEIPGYNKCPLCGEWSYKPLWLAVVLPADASERDVSVAIAEADKNDSWSQVRATLGTDAASVAAELFWDGYEAPTDRLVILRDATRPDVTLFFDVEARIQTEFYSRPRN